MQRYDKIETQNKQGKGLVYNSVVLPHIEPVDTDILIMTNDGDRLDLLANHYFGDASLWWIIATANNLTDIDLKLKAGTQLRIPSDVNKIADLIK
jgi:phage tail protein X